MVDHIATHNTVNSLLSTIPPFLTVIIPVYNGEQFLHEAICSVLAQPCNDLAIIVVNDGSTDRSLDIALEESAKDRRVIVVNQENSGVAVARNNGIEHALSLHSRYLSFLDADDVWVRDFYTENRKQEIQNSDAGLFRFSAFIANESMSRGRLHKEIASVTHSPTIPLFSFSFSAFIYPQKLFSDYSLRFPVGYKLSEDVAFLYLALSMVESLSTSSSPFFCYRSNNSSICHAKKDPKYTYINHIIPVWDWVKQELQRLSPANHCVQPRNFQGCDTMKKTFLSEFIESACVYGYSVSQIRNIIKESKLEHYYNSTDNTWVNAKSLANLNAFHTHPHFYRLKHQILGLSLQFAKRLRNCKFVQNRRYPCDLTELTYSTEL